MLIPVGDNSRRGPCGLMTWVLLIVNIYVFLYEIRLASHCMPDLIHLVDIYGFTPSHINGPYTWGEKFFPLYTHIFLHADILHLAGNMLYLWIFAHAVEDRMGPLHFLTFYMLCGFLAAIAHYASEPMSDIAAVGASGAIAGVMGAYFIMFKKAKISAYLFLFVVAKKVEIPAFWFLLFWVGWQIFMGIHIQSDPHMSNVAFGAHVGGFIAGMVLCPLFAESQSS
jgi:membrane associated rhomboid family serine protease